MALPRYVQRIARLPEVFERLAEHPDGLPLDVLAAQTGIPTGELRDDLLAFYVADVGDLYLGLSRDSVLEFLTPDGDDDDPATAEIVRIVSEEPTGELGVEHLDAAELALIYTSAQALLEIEPANEELHGAVEVLTETMFGLPSTPAAPRTWNEPLEALQYAVTERRAVRIAYSRTWSEGVNERIIDPYLLVQTRRGWEVDAGPPDTDGKLRTFLLGNLREYAVLSSSFTLPDDLPAMLEAQRATSTVRVRIPHAARWAADFYAESVTVVDDDELTATLDLALLPPVEQRVGLLLLIAGEDAVVLEPRGLVAAGPALAAKLLAHHRS